MTQLHKSRALQLLHRVVLPLDRALQAADRQTGCSAAQLQALSVIHYLKANTIGRLAAHEKISVPTASRLFEGLVQRGLARRVEGRDRRTSVLEVTDEGLEAVEIACAAREAILENLFKGLSEEEWRGLRATAGALARELGVGPEAIHADD
ncbi:MarR family winged helix-turn-helix transcriptional regulator [Pelagibacterium halotolerans]|uniref:MarR family winged helix-turn-helix transcriptional regulator n=1 Tax=Pelagibacterium halotolerans TaxID=531813 RepID=UPI00384E1B13